jgi:hypothetical protein
MEADLPQLPDGSADLSRLLDFALAKIELYHRDLVALASELPPIQRGPAV